MKTIREIEQELEKAKKILRQEQLRKEKEKKEQLLPIFQKRYTRENLRKILKERIKFSYYKDWWDWVYLWSDWKRPFWNSNCADDISEVLWLWEEFEFEEFEFDYLGKKLAEELNNILTNL